MSLGTSILIFFVLLFLGVPIAICLAATGLIWLSATPAIPSLIMATKIYGQTDSFAMMAIPFFMMAGQIMEQTGITGKFIDFAKSLVGHIRGGVAHTAMVAGVIMAGVSGSGNADTAAIGSLMIPALKKDGYDEGFAVSVIASAGSLGPIIPPSVMMIVFANAAGYSVGKIFMGGVVPGIIMAFGFCVLSYRYAKKHNIGGGKFGGWKNVFRIFCSTVGALIMPAIIIVGIVTGICTATEAGVLACVYGLLYGFSTKSLTLKSIMHSLTEACVASIGPMMIITYSSIFSYMLTRMNVSTMIGGFCAQYIHSEIAFMLFIIVVCSIAGCFIDGLATMLMLLPVLTPVVTAMGIDFQHFALVYVMALLTCQITPPVGNLLYVAAGIQKTPVNKVMKSILPFVVVMEAVILLSVFVPQIVTWLPHVIYGA